MSEEKLSPLERAVKEAVSEPNPIELANQTLERVREMCRTAHFNGYSIGYAKGFEAGVQAAMPAGVIVPHHLV